MPEEFQYSRTVAREKLSSLLVLIKTNPDVRIGICTGNKYSDLKPQVLLTKPYKYKVDSINTKYKVDSINIENLRKNWKLILDNVCYSNNKYNILRGNEPVASLSRYPLSKAQKPNKIVDIKEYDEDDDDKPETITIGLEEFQELISRVKRLEKFIKDLMRLTKLRQN